MSVPAGVVGEIARRRSNPDPTPEATRTQTSERATLKADLTPGVSRGTMALRGPIAMSIHLSEEDRISLKRLELRPMKPTRRQKAIALLRLDEGKSLAEAAEHAGIPKEQVEALAAGFAEGGLAGVGLNAKSKILVKIVQTGLGVQEYALPHGATLADLLRQHGVTTANQIVYVDGLLVEEKVPLHDGAVAVIVPQARKAAGEEPWRATIPSFRDETLFRQYTDLLKSGRHQLEPDEDEGP
jgi:sulfur carrier protein ThiS